MSGQTEKAWERFFSRDFFILFSRPLGQTEKTWHVLLFFSVYSIRRAPLGQSEKASEKGFFTYLPFPLGFPIPFFSLYSY